MLALFLIAVLQQSPPQADAKLAAVSGHVYSSSSYTALKGARVTLATGIPGSQPVTQLSDANGAYEFRGVEPGRHMLTCHRDGFLEAYAGSRPGSPHSVFFTLNEGQALGNLDCRLYVGGVITGTVLDENGVPLSNVDVRAMRRQDRSLGGFELFSNWRGVTDDHGLYRIRGLPTDTYYLRASARSDSETHARRQDELRRVQVAAGEEQRDVKLTLRPAATYSVSGYITDLPGLRLTSGTVTVTLDPTIDSGDRVEAKQQVQPDGSFHLTRLIPGHYVLSVTAPDLGVSERQPLIKPFDLEARDLTGLVVRVSTGATVRGRIVPQGKPVPPGVKVRLGRLGEFVRCCEEGEGIARVDSDLNFEISHVQPGEYQAWIFDGGYFYGHQGIRIGDSAIHRTFTVAEGVASLDIEAVMLPPGLGAWMGGKVRNEAGEPVPAVTVLAVTADPNLRMADREFSVARTEIDGSFMLQGVRPGEHVLLVWPSWEIYPVKTPHIFAQLQKDAIRVSLASGMNPSHDLKLTSGTEVVARVLEQ